MYDYEDELARLTLENGHLFAFSNTQKPAYAGCGLPDRGTFVLTADDIDGGKRELARAKPGLGPGDVDEAVMALTTGERDVQSQATALVQLAAMPASEIMGLTTACRCCAGTVPVMGPLVGLTVTAEARAKYARSGIAMASGHFPIPDLKHLAAAKAFFKQGKYAGQDPKAVTAHINARARALGGDPLDDDEDEAGRAAARRRRSKPLSGNRQRLASKDSLEGLEELFGSGGGAQDVAAGGPDGGGGAAMTASQVLGLTGPVAAIVDRNEELFLAARDGYGEPPARPPFRVHDVGSSVDGENDPDGGDTEAVVRRYLAMARKELGREAPHGSVTTSRPLTARQRRLAEQRELAGGRAQSWER